jgi:hypothetical protein
MTNTPDSTQGASSAPPADTPAATPAGDRPVATPAGDRPVATPAADRPVAAPAGSAVAAGTRPSVEDQRRDRALRRFRGLNIGAAFFGWLVGAGMAIILAAIVAAAGAALSLTQEATLKGNVATISVSGMVILAIILLVSYYSGGYVAGRLSRFSGATQGIGVWAIGVIVTAGLAIGALVAGSKYNVLAQLRLPSIPVNGQSFATGGAVALVVMALLMLLAAIVGALTGIRYHRRVDSLLTGRRAAP